MLDLFKFLLGVVELLAYNPRGLRVRPALVLGYWACNLGSGVLILSACLLFPKSPVTSVLIGLGSVPLVAYGIVLFHRSRECPPTPPPDRWVPPDSAEVARVIKGPVESE